MPKDTLIHLLARYLSLEKIEFVERWLLRLWSVLYLKCLNPESCPAGITAQELRIALNAILRAAQKQFFERAFYHARASEIR